MTKRELLAVLTSVDDEATVLVDGEMLGSITGGEARLYPSSGPVAIVNLHPESYDPTESGEPILFGDDGKSVRYGQTIVTYPMHVRKTPEAVSLIETTLAATDNGAPLPNSLGLSAEAFANARRSTSREDARQPRRPLY